MPETPTQPLVRPNGVPFVKPHGPARALAPSQAFTPMQTKRVEQIFEKLIQPLKQRIEELEKTLKGAKAADKAKAKAEEKPAAKAAPQAPATVLPSATAEISEAAQKLIDMAVNPDLKRALIAIAKKDVPEEVKLTQMSAALVRYQPREVSGS